MSISDITLSREQDCVLKKMLDLPSNMLIQGPAGSGKTVLIHKFAHECWKRGIKLACLAPTGFAAQNLPHGMTVHSFFRLPIGYFSPDEINLSLGKVHLLFEIDVILIDECSMLRSDYFAGIDFILREVNDSSRPFGGKKVILVGDIFQLPPVVDDPAIDMHIESEFGGRYFFNTEAFTRGNFNYSIYYPFFNTIM